MSGVCQLADPCHLAEGPVARSPGAQGNWAGAPGVISIGLGERLDHAQFRKSGLRARLCAENFSLRAADQELCGQQTPWSPIWCLILFAGVHLPWSGRWRGAQGGNRTPRQPLPRGEIRGLRWVAGGVPRHLRYAHARHPRPAGDHWHGRGSRLDSSSHFLLAVVLLCD